MGDIVSLSPRIEAIKWMDFLSDEISRYRFIFSDEKSLQAGILKIFRQIPSPCEPEYELSSADIVDFYWPDKKIGVEVKINDSLANLTRQLNRYSQHPSIMGLLVITSRNRLSNLPKELNKKPIICHNMVGSLL